MSSQVMVVDPCFGKRGIFCRPCFCRIPRLPKGTTWINYIRCHDDIGFEMSVKPLPADAHGLSAAHRCAAVDEHQREAALLTFLVWLC